MSTGKERTTCVHASLRIMGNALDPLDVTLAIRLPYDHIHRSGEPRIVRRRDGTVSEYSPYTGGMWSFSSKNWVDSPLLDSHVCWLLDQIEPRSIKLFELLDSGNAADIFCYLSGSGAEPSELPASTIQRAKELRLTIDIDYYQVTDDQQGPRLLGDREV